MTDLRCDWCLFFQINIPGVFGGVHCTHAVRWEEDAVSSYATQVCLLWGSGCHVPV